MATDLEALLVVIGDESVPVELRILHGVQHMIREQHRHNARTEELLMTIQDDINALGQRMDTAVSTIEQELAAGGQGVDLSPINAVADKLDSLAGGSSTPAPAPTPVPVTNTSGIQPLYLVDGNGNTDPSQWTPAPFTTPDNRPLFTFNGDAGEPGSPATGDGRDGVWHVYVGELVPTPAA